MKNFQIIALTLPGIPDPSIAIAASRAGTIGVLDLEYLSNKEKAFEQINRLTKFARHDVGLKLAATNASVLAELQPELPACLKFVLLTYHRPKALKGAIADLQQQGLAVWVECTHLDHALLAEKSGADGVIAKGHEAGGRVGNETTFILLQKICSQSISSGLGTGRHRSAYRCRLLCRRSCRGDFGFPVGAGAGIHFAAGHAVQRCKV